MQELENQISLFKKMTMPQQYQKVMGILDFLQAEVPICKQLFELFDKHKSQLNSSMLENVYASIMSVGAEVEHNGLVEDGEQASEFIEQYKNIEELTELRKIRDELENIAVETDNSVS